MVQKDSRPRFFTPNEVSSHNTASDIWVSFLGHVYDLSKLVEEHSGSSSGVSFLYDKDISSVIYF